MFSCEDIGKHLIDLIDGSLSDDLRRGLEEHLNQCPDCRAIVAAFPVHSMERIDSRQPKIPHTLWHNVQSQINALEERKSSKRLTHGKSWAVVTYSVRTVGAAAAVFLGISLGSIPEKSEATEDQALVEYYASSLSQVESLDSSAVLFDLVEPEEGR